MNRYRLPVIRRARSFWLYGYDGTRYLDLWQFDGRAYYGHNPKGMANEVKNRIAPALYSPLPHPVFHQVLKLASRTFPDYVPLVFPSFQEFSNFFLSQGFPPLPPNPWSVLQWTGPIADRVVLWRPDRSIAGSPAYVVPLLPVPLDLGAILVLSKEREPFVLPPSTPLQLTALGWGIRLWSTKEKSEIPLSFSETFPFFRREGRYLIPQATEAEYFQLYKFARSQGVVLNPLVGGISILPPRATPGDWKKILSVLKETLDGL